MHSIFSLVYTHQAALLEGVAFLSRFYWGPDADFSRDLRRGTFLKPFEALRPMISYEPPGTIDELKAIKASFVNNRDDPGPGDTSCGIAWEGG